MNTMRYEPIIEWPAFVLWIVEQANYRYWLALGASVAILLIAR